MSQFHAGCVAFITGAASGIGLAATKQLLADGVQKIALVDINNDHLVNVITSLQKVYPEAELLSVVADCSQESSVEEAVDSVVKKFGRLDLCLNAAGLATTTTTGTAEKTTEEYDRVIGLNLKGLWLCERAEIRQMLKQELRDLTTGLPFQTRGSIVNMGSIAASLALSTAGPYVMSKHGVLGLTKVDTVDYAAHGIRINAVSPGWIKTAMTARFHESELGPILNAKTPMKRWGLPEEVAHTISFLFSDKASFITGTSVEVNGGYTAL